MVNLEELRTYVVDLLERLNFENDDYTEDVIQEVSKFCSQLEIFGPEMDESYSKLMNKIQKHIKAIFLCEDRVHFNVR